MPDRLISRWEAATMLGIGEDAVEELSRQRLLRPLVMGRGGARFSLQQVRTFQKEHARAAMASRQQENPAMSAGYAAVHAKLDAIIELLSGQVGEVGWYTRSDICRLMDVGDSTIKAWVASGKLHEFKLGASFRYRRHDVHVLMAAIETASEPRPNSETD